MKQLMGITGIGAALAVAVVMPAHGMGRVEKACLQSERNASNRVLCGCIQDVADRIFTRAEQKRLVDFFENPHLTQELRQSPNPSDERFWEKYKSFGETAQAYCSPSR